MEWLEISVTVDGEAAEAVAEVMSRYVPRGVVIDLGEDALASEATVRTYLLLDEETAPKRRKIEEGLWHLQQIWPVPEPRFRTLTDEEWTSAWREQIPVLHLGHRVVIKPTWRTYDPAPGEVVLELDPGLAFGTGLHPTTQLCIEALEARIRPDMRILDLGTGTGILALAAAKLAPVEILAVDSDIDAVVVARRNARRNRVAHAIRLIHGSLAEVSGTYDLIFANILASVIIEMAEAGVATRLRLGGALIASGILTEQSEEVAQALTDAGLGVTETLSNGDWVAIVAERV